ECVRLSEHLRDNGAPDTPAYLLERLLVDVGGYLESNPPGGSPDMTHRVREARERLGAQGCRVPAGEAKVRYAWIRELLQGIVTRPAQRPVTRSDKIDKLLTHRFSGLVFFALLMFAVFQAIYVGAAPLMDLCGAAQEFVGGFIAGLVPAGPL